MLHRCLVGESGDVVRGHEFHYSTIVEQTELQFDQVYEMKDGSGNSIGPEGIRYKNAIASYIHLHFGSNPSIAGSIVESASKGRSS